MIGKTYGARCNTGSCVQVTEVDGQFVFTSTIEGNDAAIVYTPDEVATFLADVKAGHWDTLHKEARGLTEPPGIV